MRYVAFDKMLEIVKGKYARAIKNITFAEDFFATHFPNFPVMPGVLLMEAMMQVSSWLVSVSSDFKIKTKASMLKNTKLRKYVRPGDQLIVEAQIISMSGQRAILKANIKVEGKEVAGIEEVHFCCFSISTYESAEEKRKFAYYCGGGTRILDKSKQERKTTRNRF